MNVKEYLESLKKLGDFEYYVKFNGFYYGKETDKEYLEYTYFNDFIRIYGESIKSNLLLNIIKDKLFNKDIIKTILFEELDEDLIYYYLNNDQMKSFSYYVYLIKSNHKADYILKNFKTLYNVPYSLVLSDDLLLLLSSEEISHLLLTFINSELMLPVKIGFSQHHKNLYNFKIAYNEAVIALSLVNVFSNDNIYGFNTNKLDVIINGLKNASLFNHNLTDKLDDEDIVTIITFLKVNLNLAEAARKLFVHRNTLLYRIEKINKKTGLDIRNFDDALVIRIYLLLKYTKTHE